MVETLGNVADFSRSYDELMFDPRNRAIYRESNFFNVGYWLPGIGDQPTACRRLVGRLMESVPNDVARLLDAGCGCGGSTRMAKQLRPEAEVVGINISERQLQQCRAVAPGCDFALMDAAALACPGDTFDCVLCVEAAFHFRTRAAFLAEAFRVLRPGGHVALSDILFRDPRWIGDGMVPQENAAATRDDYMVLLHHVGFRDVVLEDATERCWTAFCRGRLEAIRAQWLAELIDRAAFETQSEYFENLRDRSVDQYLLVVARKPISGLTVAGGRTA
jgi:SAM-dependent methyltransferase